MKLHDTLQYVLTSDIPAQHKSVLIAALTQAMREQVNADERKESSDRKMSEPWQEAEVAQLQAFLDSKVARSWQHADELAMHLATHLHRSVDDVRAKAMELGYGMSVDYRRAHSAALAKLEEE